MTDGRTDGTTQGYLALVYVDATDEQTARTLTENALSTFAAANGRVMAVEAWDKDADNHWVVMDTLIERAGTDLDTELGIGYTD